jgi:uncharacterized protein (TIGR02147 family)
MQTAATTYRGWLKSLMAEKLAKNPRLSLRGFAKTAGVAASTLSEVLKGKKNLSPATALKVAARLGLADTDAERFLLLVQYENESNPDLKDGLARKLRADTALTPAFDADVDRFKMIADPHHVAILEMVGQKALPQTAAAMAKRLGLATVEAEAALDRLERLGFISREGSGALTRTQPRIVFRSAVPAEALRRYHKRTLALAVESLESQSTTEKWVGTETFAFDPAQLPAASEIIEECFQKLCALAAQGKTRSEIYHLSTLLFRISIPRTSAKGVQK